ncbi:MAG: aryl-sulfate sulfotransferase [Lachnospiraceae bacterium]|nr:aryl-sulfate sulfotransferase [Lachnospiraceae bacterium]
MKKKLRVIIITSVIMMIGMGVFLWKMNGLSKEKTAEQEALLKEERDLLGESKLKVIDEVEKVNIVPLYLSGENKNVVTVGYANEAEIYEGSKGNGAEKTLTDIKKNKKFTFQEPLWAYNPYGTNPQSMYVYFRSNGSAYCRYTVSVEDKQIADFTRTLLNNGSGNLSKEHEYQLIGLLPGRTNYITIKMYNKKKELASTGTWSIDVPADTKGFPERMTVEKGYSKQTITNGLYTVFADGVKGSDGKKHYALLQYDNSGILRANFPLNGSVGRNMQIIYDSLVFQSAPNQIVRMNYLGQVTNSYPVYGYNISGEYVYDGSGSLYMIATANAKNATINSKILKLELESGEVSQELDMDTLLPNVYKKAVKKQGKKKAKNWVQVNSIQCTGSNQLLVSSQTLSSIFKVSQVGSLLPSVDYIIADSKLWKDDKELKGKVLTKALAEGQEVEETPEPAVQSILETPEIPDLFESQYGQNSMTYTQKSGEGQYYLEMLNNNSGKGASQDGSSYYYKYFVDEGAGSYQLNKMHSLSYTAGNGNVIMGDNVIIYCNSGEKTIQETDKKGKLIRKFTSAVLPYRVYKTDWKGFWFY